MKKYATPSIVVFPTDPEDILCLNGSVPAQLGSNETPGANIFAPFEKF